MADIPKPENLAPFLLKKISEKTFDPKRLTRHERRICVRYLIADMKHTQQEIASILQCAQSVVSKDKRRIMEQNIWMIDTISEREMAVDIAITADVASARLFRKGKEKEAFEVRSKAIDVLQSLGYLKRAPIELKGTLTMQEILKLAVSAKDEEVLLGNADNGSSHSSHKNGSG